MFDTGPTTVSAGVPQTATATKILLEGDTGWTDTGVGQNVGKGFNQTEKLATTLSYQDYWICSEFYLSITGTGNKATRVDAEVLYKVLGGVWRPVGMELSIDGEVTSYMHDEMQPYIIIPKNSDVVMTATATLANTVVSGYINGYLAKVQTGASVSASTEYFELSETAYTALSEGQASVVVRSMTEVGGRISMGTSAPSASTDDWVRLEHDDPWVFENLTENTNIYARAESGTVKVRVVKQ